MTVYCIPGLAADARVFKNIALPRFCSLTHIEWISADQEESLAQYASRLCAQIDTSRPFALMGLSLGGMLVVEIAKIIKPKLVILISSIPLSNNLPPYYHWAGAVRLHKVVPIKLLQQASMLKRVFSTETTEEKELVKDMIRKSEPQMIRWGLTAIINWKSTEQVQNIIHIHGTRDFILPLRFTKPTYTIKGGGHLMIINRATAINELLQKALESFK